MRLVVTIIIPHMHAKCKRFFEKIQNILLQFKIWEKGAEFRFDSEITPTNSCMYDCAFRIFIRAGFVGKHKKNQTDA